ncbi:hypothetical protein CMQ_6818 [Grosmannia clavigera kw1407]|uniref:Mg2+ transporter zinc transport protein n=1 Tax=Grosmannia clavigera (strain kw1407 / UAMH 11150) TaxID=655863 RepID=F0X7R0_GROCL|nr:uncharacterized protein CMQ_6818 [Grosmannia clavigera kw1407]EFX06497.1 hypothetical protein CMQ_6818 [Grosmannia clavigera kw1407]
MAFGSKRARRPRLISSTPSFSSGDRASIGEFDDADGTRAMRRKNDSLLSDERGRLANADGVRECNVCRNAFSSSFRMPELWWAPYCRRSNGHFGYEATPDENGNIAEIISWARFLIKVLDTKAQHTWCKMNVYVRWLAATQQTMVVLFDPPLDQRDRWTKLLLEQEPRNKMEDPFWVYSTLVGEIVSLQDKAVWTARTHIRKIEKKREVDQWSAEPPRPKFSSLHDLARHATHVSETLDVAMTTMASMLRHHTLFLEARQVSRPASPRPISQTVHERLLFFEHMLASLRCRSLSNKERLQNEIQLSFNVVTQYDANLSLQIGYAAKSDSRAMRTIAFLTAAFLPATFMSAIFSTSFFTYNGDAWAMSSHFWVYWAFALPLTALTCGLWYAWQRRNKTDCVGRVAGSIV